MSHRDPEFIIFTGPMFGSKTSKMISLVDRFTYQGKKVITFKPSIDKRYDENMIVSHSGIKIDAISVRNGADVLANLMERDDRCDIVAVDEAFMLDGISDVLIWLFKKGVSVIVSSLTISSSCDIFSEMAKILPWATRIEVCPAVCPACGHDAFYTHKKNDDGQMISVGGADMYEPRCWEHHVYINRRDDDSV